MLSVPAATATSQDTITITIFDSEKFFMTNDYTSIFVTFAFSGTYMSIQATDRQCFIIALSFPLHAIVFALKFIYFKYLYEYIFQACDTQPKPFVSTYL